VLITAGAFGWKFAIGKAVAAVALGLMGGFGVRFMMRKGVFKNPLRRYWAEFNASYVHPGIDTICSFRDLATRQRQT
jgi:uncharacterized membrane protein YraQ (UPF0718 family)